jgi:SM-20-related protein
LNWVGDGGMTIAADTINKVPSHGVVRNWLGSEAVTRLLRFVQSNEHRFEDSKVTRKEEEGSVDNTNRVSRKLQSIDELKKELCPKLESLLPVIFDELGNKPFIPSRIEVELVAHSDGAFFARHNDIFTGPDQKGRGSRAISAVYYFHALPKAFSGGVLRLHSLAASGRQGTFVDIAPDRDTLVFFPSFFPHEVLPVKCTSGQFLDSRFAINFWLYQK